jgi:HK97 family phage prohead protease
MGDIVEPLGVKVAADIPLFLYHDHEKVVGRARFGKATKAGIPFEASIPNIAEAGALKDRVDEAWQMVKYSLITAVSIGFRSVKDKVEALKDGGLRFLETEVMELSLVPVPAQPDAVIQSFKSMPDDEFIRAFGGTPVQPAQGHADESVVEKSPGETGTQTKAVKRGPVQLIKRKVK